MNLIEFKLAGTDYLGVVINQREETSQESQSVEIGAIHWIHVIDRSGSMSYSINGLLDNVEETIDLMGDNDYFSLVWFSGPGQCKTLVRGAKKDKDSIKALLKTIRSTVGVTCFSEPMAEINTIVDDLAVICPNFSVTFFTDGLPVVPWTVEEEFRRVREQVKKLSPKVLALNTIGYGYSYDRDFLTEIASASQFGQYLHSNQIEDYSVIFKHNYERVSELVVEGADVAAKGCQVLYLTRNSSKLAVDGELTLRALNKRKNQFVIFQEKSKGDFVFSYNGDNFHTAELKRNNNKATIENIQYALAYEYYYLGQRQLSLDILSTDLKDRALIDKQLVAFTYNEVSDYAQELKKAVFDHGTRRSDGLAPDGYVPAGDAFCVFDLLNILACSDAQYVPSSNYQRIGLKTEDTFNLFKKDPDKTPTAPLSEMVFNKDKLNLSIRFLQEGTVELNPVQADRVGLSRSVEAKRFRNHTIIKDGTLNLEEIRVNVDADTYFKLRELERQHKVSFMGDSKSREDGREELTVFLDRLPIINRTYLNKYNTTESVYTLIRKQLMLDARAKVLNYHLKKNEKTSAFVSAAVGLTDDQVQCLKDHGVDKTYTYVGVDNKTASKEDGDFYESRSLTFYLKGFSSLPSVNDVIKRLEDPKGKALTAPQAVVKEQMDYVAGLSGVNLDNPNEDVIKVLQAEQKKTKDEIFRITSELSALKIAKVLTGDWFDGLVVNDKGESVYTAPDSGMLVVKSEREKVYFSVA